MLRRTTALATALAVAGSLLLGAPRPAAASDPPDPVVLSAPGVDAFASVAATDGAGRVVVAWVRTIDGVARIESSSRTATSPWTAPQAVSPPGVNAVDPKIAVNAAGTAVLVWRAVADNDYRVQAAVRETGAAWSAGIDLSVADKSARSPDVVIDGAGNATVLWLEDDVLPSRLVMRRRPAGSALWTALAPLSSSGHITSYDLVASGAGAVTAVWNHGATFSEDKVVKARSALNGTTWGSITTLEPLSGSALRVVAGADEQGHVFAIWEDSINLDLRFLGAARPARARHVIAIKTFAATRGGTIRVVVLTKGRPVRIDGLLLRR